MVHNERVDLGYQLSLSIGSVIIHPHNVLSIEELMAQADRAMYANKRSKSANAGSTVAIREVLTTKQLEVSRRPDPVGHTR